MKYQYKKVIPSEFNIQNEIQHAFQTRKHDGGPAYLRLALALQDAIQSQRIPTGAGLPSERTMGDILSLSRVTIRRALDQLIQQGLLRAKQGSGTFVSSRLVESMTLLASFSEDMVRRGLTPGSIWISRALAWPTADETMALAIPSDCKVVRCARIRTANDMPMALEFAVVQASHVGHQADFGDSLYTAMRQQGIQPVRAIQRVRCESASPEHAQQLGIDANAAVFAIERRSFTEDGRPVELTHSIYRGDLYDYVVEIGIPVQKTSSHIQP